MKALRTIGFRKACRFVLERVCQGLLNLAFLPQVRVGLLRLFGARIGHNCIVHDIRIMNVYRGSFRNLHLGDNCFIGQECLLDLADRIVLGDSVTVAERINILTHMTVGYPDHPLQVHFPAQQAPVFIRDGAFVGVGCTLLCGTTVGEESLVAAMSIVTKDVPAHVLAAGVPARVIRQLGSRETASGSESCKDATT